MTARRPLASRDAGVFQRLAAWLAKTRVTPNQISGSSVVFAALACGLFWASEGSGQAAGMLVAGAVCVQLRLMANLLDGMVAVEGGKSTPDGAFWNEVPDRVADLLILVGAGLAVGNLALGCAVGAMAVLTAYVREFARAEGAPADYSGPMAKPHRMAAITLGALVAAVEVALFGTLYALLIALWVVTLGAGVTAVRRSLRALDYLRSNE